MDQNNPKETESSLRRRAETLLQDRTIDLQALSLEDIQHLIHELQVYQVELELQNEQLRQTQRELEATRNKFIYLYDFAPVGYLTMDRQGRIWEANLTAVTRLGLERGNIIRHLFSNFVAPADQDLYYFWRRNLFIQESPQACEIRLVRKDGAEFYAHLEGVVAGETDIEENLARVAITDITEQKQAALTLAEERTLLRTLIDHLPDYIYIKDRESRFITGNTAVAQVMGAWEVGHLTGKTDFDFYPEEIARQFRADEKTVIESGRPLLNQEERLIDAEGQERIVSTSKVPLRDQAGQVTGLVGIGRDITQRKRVENERNQLFTAVSQQREALRALATRLAEVQETERQQLARELHDQVGQNLTALGFNLNFILNQLANPSANLEQLKARLEDSLALVEQTTDRTRDVMTQLRPPMLDDYGLFDTLEWYAEQFARRMRLPVVVRGEPPEPRLPAPVENALFRITQEALTNVAKHAQATQATISLSEKGRTIYLAIADNGIGFDPDRSGRPHIPLSLGLLTIWERAEAIGATCQIESQPGKGTQVVIEVTR